MQKAVVAVRVSKTSDVVVLTSLLYDNLVITILRNLSTNVFETRTVTGRRRQLLLTHFDLNQLAGMPLF